MSSSCPSAFRATRYGGQVDSIGPSIGFDVYNVFNSAAILTYKQTFVLLSATNPTGTWLQPTAIQQSGFAKFSAQIDF